VQLYAAGYLAILVFQKVLHYFLPAPSYGLELVPSSLQSSLQSIAEAAHEAIHVIERKGMLYEGRVQKSGDIRGTCTYNLASRPYEKPGKPCKPWRLVIVHYRLAKNP
jgi:hypothetical protein